MNTFCPSKNNYQIKLIKNLYCGELGETQQMLQFLYFCYVTNINNDFYEILQTIQKDDSSHHNILGELLHGLGDEPSYFSGNHIPLSGVNFEYFIGLKNIINYALEIKEKIIINYKIAINKIQEKNIKKILENILADEQKHKQLLQNLQTKYTLKN